MLQLSFFLNPDGTAVNTGKYPVLEHAEECGEQLGQQQVHQEGKLGQGGHGVVGTAVDTGKYPGLNLSTQKSRENSQDRKGWAGRAS